MTRSDRGLAREALGLSWLVLTSGALSIGAHLALPRTAWLVYLTKPLTTVLVLVLALHLARVIGATPRSRWGIVLGLLFSLAGDVFLMLPRDLFVAGLASFLVAHVCYLVAFTDGVRLAARPLPFLAWAAVGAAILAFLWPGLPAGLRLPVVAYVVVLLSMAAQAAVRGAVLGTMAARLGAFGGACFAISDATLAIDRFRAPFAAATVMVLLTYWVAQWLIALSVGARPSAGR